MDTKMPNSLKFVATSLDDTETLDELGNLRSIPDSQRKKFGDQILAQVKKAKKLPPATLPAAWRPPWDALTVDPRRTIVDPRLRRQPPTSR